MSQKGWEVYDDLISSEDDSNSIDIEEEVLSKSECERFFREEVRDWLDRHGKDLFGDGMPIPQLVKKSVNTPYKPPYKKQKAEHRLNETQEIKKL